MRARVKESLFPSNRRPGTRTSDKPPVHDTVRTMNFRRKKPGQSHELDTRGRTGHSASRGGESRGQLGYGGPPLQSRDQQAETIRRYYPSGQLEAERIRVRVRETMGGAPPLSARSDQDGCIGQLLGAWSIWISGMVPVWLMGFPWYYGFVSVALLMIYSHCMDSWRNR